MVVVVQGQKQQLRQRLPKQRMSLPNVVVGAVVVVVVQLSLDQEQDLRKRRVQIHPPKVQPLMVLLS